MNLKINSLQHVGLPVTNLEVSLPFYQRLGFELVMQATFPHEGGQGQVRMLRRAGLTLELYQMPAPALDEVRQRGNGRIDHIAFDVDDIDEAYATLQAAGFTMLEAQPSFLNFWDRGCRFFNIAGPDGERLEFCQIL
jgi:catechol 2,3-dioxygenase-like lactoylglutathione lyase family enzyme